MSLQEDIIKEFRHVAQGEEPFAKPNWTRGLYLILYLVAEDATRYRMAPPETTYFANAWSATAAAPPRPTAWPKTQCRQFTTGSGYSDTMAFANA